MPNHKPKTIIDREVKVEEGKGKWVVVREWRDEKGELRREVEWRKGERVYVQGRRKRREK